MNGGDALRSPMGLEGIYNIITESVYALVIFGAALSYATFRGRQAIMNVILGLYFALLISIQFPYYNALLTAAGGDPKSDAIIKLVLFSMFTIVSTILFARLMPDEFLEHVHESFGKKIILALAATVLILAFSYQVLPIAELVSTNTPLQVLFAPADYFFLWLLVPLVILFLI